MAALVVVCQLLVSYAVNGSMVEVWVMIAFGALGNFMRVLQFAPRAVSSGTRSRHHG